jgi:Ca2+-binding RTX toxin-like protein
MLLTSWPEVASSAWPSFWNSTETELEAKWQTTETTLAKLKTDFPAGNKTLSGVNTYSISIPGSGRPRRVTDLYYDMPNDELANSAHVLRHRNRYDSTSGNPANFDWSINTLLGFTGFTVLDYERVQYKNTPERFGAPWFRQEFGGDRDLSSTEVANAINNGSYPADQPDADDPIIQLTEDHPDVLWASQSGGITDDLRVIDFRYRIRFRRPNTTIDIFEMSLDKVFECEKVNGSYPAITANPVPTGCRVFYEAELEAVEQASSGGTIPQANVDELFQLRDWFEQEYNVNLTGYSLTPSYTSKGGVTVPDHGAIETDDGHQEFFDKNNNGSKASDEPWTRNFTTTGTWTTSTVDAAFGNDIRESASGAGTNTASWEFGLLSPGRYKIATTWTSGGDRANNVPYEIYDGSKLISTVTVNQQNAPSGYSHSGNWEDLSATAINWHELGDSICLSGDSLTVKMKNTTGGKAIADAVRIQHVDDAGVSASFSAGVLTVNGGAADDCMVISSSWAQNGDVLVNGSHVSAGGGYVLSGKVTSISVSGNDGADNINIGGVNAAAFPNLTGLATVRGGNGNDNITGIGISSAYAINDWLYGDAGDDVIAGGIGYDIVFGGSGNDTVTGGGNTDEILGEAGNDSLSGDAGNDYLFGGDDNDTLRGGADSDAGYGENGNDLVYGDDGDDRLRGGGQSEVTNDGDDQLSGGAGIDLADYSNRTSSIYISADGNANDGKINTEHDNILTDIENLTAGSANDLVAGNSSANILRGGAGSDTLHGYAGNDSLYGEAGIDYAFAGDDNDYISGGTENDYTYGGYGNDLVHGDDGADWMRGGELWITSNDGNDTLYGGNGNDSIRGGDGNDSLHGDANDDWFWGEAGNDTIYGGSGNDNAYGGTNNDYLQGDSGNDNLYGEAGADSFHTQDGVNANDVINGGIDSDIDTIIAKDYGDYVYNVP